MSRSPDFQTPPPVAPDELLDPNLTPLPTRPGIKYVARALAATYDIELGTSDKRWLQANIIIAQQVLIKDSCAAELI